MGLHGRTELPNIYNLSDVDHAGSCFDTSIKQRMYPTIDGTTAIFPMLGQSRIANNSAAPATPYVPTNTIKCINLNPYDGFYYVGKDPWLGCTAQDGYYQTGWLGRFCDELIDDAAYTQVVLIPIGIAGSSVTEWVPSTGIYNPRILAVSSLLTAMGLTPTAWLWQQGTTDAIDGMSQGNYQTHLRSVISYQRGLTGRSSDKWVIARDTIYGGSTSSKVRAAQAAVANDPNNYLGPDCDTIDPADYDGTHYNDSGNAFIAGLWSANIQAHF